MRSQLDNLLASLQVEFAGGFRRANELKNHSYPPIQLVSLATLQYQLNSMVNIL